MKCIQLLVCRTSWAKYRHSKVIQELALRYDFGTTRTREPNSLVLVRAVITVFASAHTRWRYALSWLARPPVDNRSRTYFCTWRLHLPICVTLFMTLLCWCAHPTSNPYTVEMDMSFFFFFYWRLNDHLAGYPTPTSTPCGCVLAWTWGSVECSSCALPCLDTLVSDTVCACPFCMHGCLHTSSVHRKCAQVQLFKWTHKWTELWGRPSSNWEPGCEKTPWVKRGTFISVKFSCTSCAHIL